MIKIWDPTSYSCIATLRGHAQPLSMDVYDNQLIFGCSDNTIKIWNLAADHASVLREIAKQFHDPDPATIDLAENRFARMPEKVKNKVYKKLPKLEFATSKDKAQAIGKYLTG